MDNFLLQCEDVSFADLCHAADPCGGGEAEACDTQSPSSSRKRSPHDRKARRKRKKNERKRKKAKSEVEEDKEEATKAEDSDEPDQSEVVAAQSESSKKEPDATGSCPADGPPTSPEPAEETMSKRALRRAMFGVNRRSGGKKHKKKGAAKTDPYYY